MVGFDSELWESLTGEYGNVKEYVEILMGKKEPKPFKKLNLFKQNEEDNYNIAFDNLCENLWHRMKFHSAIYIVLPYFCELMKRKSDDEEWVFKLFQSAGLAVSTDINKPEDNISAGILKEYRDAKDEILQLGLKLITENIEFLKRKNDFDRIEIYTGVLALVGHPKRAYTFIMNMPWEKAKVECPYCKHEMEVELKDVVLTDYAQNFDRIKMSLKIMEMLEDCKFKNRFKKFYECIKCEKCGKEILIIEGAQKKVIK